MKIEEIKTWNELQDYLLERIDFATDEKANVNSSFTKERIWNMYIEQCLKYSGQILPPRTHRILIKNVRRDFK